MRRLCMLMVLASLAGACNDDDEKPLDASLDGSVSSDAGTQSDAAVSTLPRPGALERPPSGLPADLKPPR